MGNTLLEPTSVVANGALLTPFGLILPPGAKIAAFVRSTGAYQPEDEFLDTNLVSTLAAGLARARAGYGDYVICLPGHAENVADATTISNALVAGVRVVGIGQGANKPTFTWTTTTSKILVNVADVMITGCKFLLDGIDAVVKAFDVTAADFAFINNEVEVSTTAKACALCLNLGTGAHRADISYNVFRGLTASPVTDGILVAGAITDARITKNEMHFAGTTTNGNIRVSGVALGLKILDNVLNNTVAVSVACIVYANVAATGTCKGNVCTVLSTGAVSAGVTGITVGGTANLTGYFNNYTVNDPNKSGLLTPAVDS